MKAKVMSKKRDFIESSGNVFVDAGLENADELLVKAKIMAELAHIIEERGLTQTKAAELLKIPQPEISKIMNGRLSRFSLQRLIELLTAMNRNVKIVVERSHEKGRVSIEGLFSSHHTG